jgi:hypothetical protein
MLQGPGPNLNNVPIDQPKHSKLDGGGHKTCATTHKELMKGSSTQSKNGKDDDN